ncbi:hypothetical protein [Paenibacillus riograndensis]|nr:hypothetical protein [Paenibacillus riograndensis]
MNARQRLPQKHAAGGLRECILRETLAFFVVLGVPRKHVSSSR